MENAHVAAVPHAHATDEAHTFDRKAIWRTFRILLYITVFELLLAIGYYEIEFSNPHLVKHLLNGVFVVLTLAKAFFIIAEFMHLRHEIRNMILTISIPALLFIWFITAFLWDGNSYKNLRNTYDRHYKDHAAEKVEHKEPAKAGEAEEPGKIH
ncbi:MULTISPECIES: cytochrome C oxidase subunit IV family protein [Niastella]|uniref:Cytochrome C oxidase subunit IV family protein n=1 Tax=Niastella soli TaxID=2821487 RepID=A0ABS3YQZ0_9BACT|nr:cytochrome C oxidase subunit IV family protein [Niastella soli]MBO9199870.1 cytochrome C oxidase subunit IV family protein [Niastella soli]